MEEQKEQIKDPADTVEASINKIPVVEEQPPEPVRRKKTGGEENRFGKKAKIAFEKSADSEPVEEVISINRITKVTKGGKKLSFSALVVVGDTKGRVGYSLEKAAEVSIAIRKSIASAKNK